jgi:hypothetical protein
MLSIPGLLPAVWWLREAAQLKKLKTMKVESDMMAMPTTLPSRANVHKQIRFLGTHTREKCFSLFDIHVSAVGASGRAKA